ncbi:hypothetical protein C1H76_5197 [Elsinoe australis]|uniref:Carboxylic ester hydrolase n=1 Tax=Elsinoe australis TaxID=40998 RepID=A0A4U7AYQ3_9PEZI|nr:hypothetical protein C1H76_5197 [Elsinoe australis]
MAALLSHPSIGKIQGKSTPDTTQYLGLQYGVLTDRFATATLPTYDPSTTHLDATHHAPTAFQPPDTVNGEHGLIQQPLPCTYRETSLLDGLALSITVPSTATPTSSLPILAFIHGGGFAIGSTTWPQYDFSRLVRLAVARGTPFIGVGINYRLGIPGFLWGEEMRAAGYQPNRGLLDQQLALRWIQKYIGGFGGDAGNVTVAGESAGAAAITYHFHQEEKLFRRAVAMSGTDLLVKPLPKEVAEMGFGKVCELLGLGEKGEERVKGLREVDGMEMLGKIGMAVQTGPVLDGEVIRYASTYESLKGKGVPGTKWCESLMIGDCAFDGNILFLRIGPIKAGIASKFVAAAEKVLPADTAKQLLPIYDFNTSTDDETAFISVLRFINDIGFYAPTQAYASHFTTAGRDAYVYRFNAPNPWPGMWQGESSHVLDVAYLFQNYNKVLPSDKEREVAKKFGELFIDFVAGKAPLEKRSPEGGKALAFGKDDVQLVEDVPAQTGRREDFEELGQEIGYDALDRVLGTLLMG